MGATYPAGATKISGETLALTTTYATIGIPGIETKQAIVYVPSTDFRMHINPAILAVYFWDNDKLGTARWVDLTRNLTDRTSNGSGNTLDTLTTSDRLFVCFSDPVRGMWVDMTASLNTTDSRIMVCEYWDGSDWTSMSETDGTITNAARSLGKDAAVTWTAVTDWQASGLGVANHAYGAKAALDDVDTTIDTNEELTDSDTEITMDINPSSAIVAGDYIIIETEVMWVVSSSATNNLVTVTRGVLGSTAATHTTNQNVYLYNIQGPNNVGFWVKLNWTGGDMSNNVEIEDLWSINNDENYGYFQAGSRHHISFDRRVTGALEFDLAAGTDTAYITWIRTVI